MSQRPSTPVRVPSSAANNTPATLDPDLRSQINAILLRDGHVPKIQDALLHALNANPSNWPTAVQSHALALLRSGEITTFPALLRRVLDDIRNDSGALSIGGLGSGAGASSSAASASSAASSSTSGSSSPSSATNGSSSVKTGEQQQQQQQNGSNNGNGNSAAKRANGANNHAAGDKVSLAVPSSVVEEALRVTRECLENVCEVDDKA